MRRCNGLLKCVQTAVYGRLEVFQYARCWSPLDRNKNKQPAYKRFRLIASLIKPLIQIEVDVWIEVVNHAVIKLDVVDLNRSDSVYASNHFSRS